MLLHRGPPSPTKFGDFGERPPESVDENDGDSLRWCQSRQRLTNRPVAGEVFRIVRRVRRTPHRGGPSNAPCATHAHAVQIANGIGQSRWLRPPLPRPCKGLSSGLAAVGGTESSDERRAQAGLDRSNELVEVSTDISTVDLHDPHSLEKQRQHRLHDTRPRLRFADPNMGLGRFASLARADELAVWCVWSSTMGAQAEEQDDTTATAAARSTAARVDEHGERHVDRSSRDC